MIKNIIKPFLTLLLISVAVTASAGSFFFGKDKRVEVVKVYLHDLQMADVHGITSLFVANGRVISTSQGCVNAAAFFNSFLPEIKSAKVTINHPCAEIPLGHAMKGETRSKPRRGKQ